MPCETCGHTLQRVTDAIFWCPRCGTLNVEYAEHRQEHVPTLVDRCRRYEAEALGGSPPARWVSMGIAEAIHRAVVDKRNDLQKSYAYHFHCFTRSGVWGTCGSCPMDNYSEIFPEKCVHFARSDHQLPLANLVQLYERAGTPQVPIPTTVVSASVAADKILRANEHRHARGIHPDVCVCSRCRTNGTEACSIDRRCSMCIRPEI